LQLSVSFNGSLILSATDSFLSTILSSPVLSPNQ
jgi:hypothetical protein